MLMVMSTKANGKMTRPMVLVYTCILMVPNMKDTGRKINNTVKEKKHGLMVLAIKVIMLKAKKTELANLDGLMDPLMMVNS